MGQKTRLLQHHDPSGHGKYCQPDGKSSSRRAGLSAKAGHLTSEHASFLKGDRARFLSLRQKESSRQAPGAPPQFRVSSGMLE